MNSIEHEIVENIGGTVHNWMQRLEVTHANGEDFFQLPNRVRYQGIDSGVMRLWIDDIGDFTVKIEVKRLPPPGPEDDLGVFGIEEREQETDVPVSQLLTGDSVFSESAGTWHDVRVDGQALFLKRGESWVPMSHLPRDTVFRTRRGASGRAAGELFDNFGGEVIRDARD